MKPKKKLPTRGDSVKLRGREPRGVIAKMDEETQWVTVDWDKGFTVGPRYVHLLELENYPTHRHGVPPRDLT